MTDNEKIKSFKKYMQNKGLDKEIVEYNVKVVKLLSSEVLFYFKEGIESIDTFSFEEFTDMVTLIDDELGGREGIPKMMQALLEMTEFLKIEKLIKGGKIAHYKKMFSNADYYLDKYDKMTGRRDDSKEFFKDILSHRLTSEVVKVVEDVNIYDFSTLRLTDKLLNDIPVQNNEENIDTGVLKKILIEVKLMEKKGNNYETSKKGRTFSRLTIEEQYALLLYFLIDYVNWEFVFADVDSNFSYDIRTYFLIFSSIFYKKNKISILPQNVTNIKKEDMLIEIASDNFRIAKAESLQNSKYIFDICFKGMGILSAYFSPTEGITYITNDFGQKIMALLYKEYMNKLRIDMNIIGNEIKCKKYEEAEKEILKFLSTYGGNTIMWDYFGQLLLLKRSYKYAYAVLKHGYETSSKRGKISKSMLYHLVLCCKKLKLEEDINIYEKKLQNIGKA